MEKTSVRCATNSISRFILLVSCQTLKSMPAQIEYGKVAASLKLLKPVLDEVVDHKIYANEKLLNECEDLDIAVSEAREFMENWCPKMSKICSVLQSERLLMKVLNSSLDVCHILCGLLQSSPPTTTLRAVQLCMQELQSLDYERISCFIEDALGKPKKEIGFCPEYLLKVIKPFNLTSSQELLKERIALEKERTKENSDHINQIVEFFTLMCRFLAKSDYFKGINGVPIPPYFRCPLSMDLMLDPVTVGSGQIYERASILKWLEHGLTICPQTRQTLTHTNLIPNYTVKAMIKSWCEDNHINLSNHMSLPTPLNHVSPQELVHADSFHCGSFHSNSPSRSSLELGNGFEKQKIEVSSGFMEEFSVCLTRESQKFHHTSPEQSYSHSRTESASSAISSLDYGPTASTEASRTSHKHENGNELSGEITSEYPTSPSNIGSSCLCPCLSGKQFDSSQTGKLPFSPSESTSNDFTTPSHAKKLIESIKNQSNEIQTTAAAELRLLAKDKMENRIIIGKCGAIPPLISLLYSGNKLTQENAATALLNLSLNEENKAMISRSGALEPLIHVLETGNSVAKENSAAALFSLSVLDEYKVKIGRSKAVEALVDLLGSGTLRGKKDAATALFSLSIFHENKARIVKAGAVKCLVELMDPTMGLVDKAVALLANLSTIPDGRSAIAREGGIPLLVEVVETGSTRGKENAAFILLQLCINSSNFCSLVLQEGAVPPLVALSQCGTPRAKEKAQQLLSHFRNQREGATGRRKL